MKSSPNFQHLLGNFKQSTFFEAYWGKSPLLIKAEDRNSYLPISNDGLNQFFGNSRLSYPYIKLFLEGESLPFEEFRNQKMGPNSWVVDMDKVFDFVYKGYSLSVNSLDRMDAKLSTFCAELTMELRTGFWANIYVSPSNGKCFKKHMDDHDVFALQVSGKKSWTIHQPNADSIEFMLEQGDLLYIPKGFAHEADADNSHSVHLTLAADFKTYNDLIKEMWKELKMESAFEKRLDLFSTNEDKSLLEFKELLQDKLILGNLKRWRKKIAESVGSNSKASAGKRFDKWLKLERMDENTWLMVHPDARILPPTADGFSITIQVSEKEVSLPLFFKEIMEEVNDLERFRVVDIRSQLSLQKLLTVFKKLILEGAIAIGK